MYSLTKLIGILVAVVVSFAITTPVWAGPTPPPLRADHYLRYDNFLPQAVSFTVSASDQFNAGASLVLDSLDFMSTPVDKSGEGIQRPDEHMAWYNISSDNSNPQPPRTATIINQFGTVDWTLGDSRYLMVPSIKNATGALSGVGNHWKCYDGIPVNPPPFAFINLEDQFGPQTVIPLEAPGTLLCNPVDKDGEGIPMPQEHLACYPLGFPEPVNQLVALDNQFGTFINVVAGTPDLFCLPSQKLFATPTPMTPTPTAAMPTPTAVTPTPTAFTPTPSPTEEPLACDMPLPIETICTGRH